MTSPDYEQKILQWRQERENSLRKENGWLSLAGLFWLKEGENRIGSDPASDILLPERLPAAFGTIHLDGGQATLQVEDGRLAYVNGTPVDTAMLKPDVDENPSFITLDGIRMVVIQRPSGIGLRLWDNLRPERQSFSGRQWFPINEALCLPARYTRHAVPKKAMIPDIFGTLVESDMQGEISFELDGRPFTLQVFEADGELELHFQDTTNGKTTYPSGRYFYTGEPITQGEFTLDFNYAYSPPCAFTPYATCTFAPQENRLPVPIEAGEMYGSHP